MRERRASQAGVAALVLAAASFVPALARAQTFGDRPRSAQPRAAGDTFTLVPSPFAAGHLVPRGLALFDYAARPHAGDGVRLAARRGRPGVPPRRRFARAVGSPAALGLASCRAGAERRSSQRGASPSCRRPRRRWAISASARASASSARIGLRFSSAGRSTSTRRPRRPARSWGARGPPSRRG